MARVHHGIATPSDGITLELDKEQDVHAYQIQLNDNLCMQTDDWIKSLSGCVYAMASLVQREKAWGACYKARIS